MKRSSAIGPIAIGGVGGSGTRVVSELLQKAGIFVGDDLNAEADTLTFTFLFKFHEALLMDRAAFSEHLDLLLAYLRGEPRAISAEIVERALNGSRGGQHSRHWLEKRLEHLRERVGSQRPLGSVGQKGWKEPNTHILLDRLIEAQPDLRYIHVLRHGLDMAVSRNQNQVRLWGGLIPGTEPDDSPRGSLRFWCASNARSLAFADRLGSRHLVVNYDRLCLEPQTEAKRILAFVGIKNSAALAAAFGITVIPTTTGRSRDLPLTLFDSADVDYVRSLGFAIESR